MWEGPAFCSGGHRSRSNLKRIDCPVGSQSQWPIKADLWWDCVKRVIFRASLLPWGSMPLNGGSFAIHIDLLSLPAVVKQQRVIPGTGHSNGHKRAPSPEISEWPGGMMTNDRARVYERLRDERGLSGAEGGLGDGRRERTMGGGGGGQETDGDMERVREREGEREGKRRKIPPQSGRSRGLLYSKRFFGAQGGNALTHNGGAPSRPWI